MEVEVTLHPLHHHHLFLQLQRHTHQHTSKGFSKTPLLKLDVKFDLPMYNGEVNVEKLENWVHQLEVYYKIQTFNMMK